MMLSKVNMVKTAALLAALAVGGCSTRFMPQDATEIAIIPVEVSHLFTAEEGTTRSPSSFEVTGFTPEFADYFSRHRSMLLTQKVSLEWQGRTGAAMAEHAKSTLLKAGIDPSMLTVTENTTGPSGMTIRYVHHEVAVSECQPYTSTPIKPMVGNCYVESSRFQSLVNPEKMVPETTFSKEKPVTIKML